MRKIFVFLAGALLLGCGAKDDVREAPRERTSLDHPVAAGVVPGGALTQRYMLIGAKARPDEAMEGVFQPRSDVAPWRFELPIDWEADPFDDRNWRYQLHALRIIDPFIRGYEKEKDAAYLVRAKEIALDWIGRYPKGPRGESAPATGSMAWQDMGTGLRALRLSYLYERILSGELPATPEEAGRIESSLEEHAGVLSHPLFFSPGNHGIFVAHGLMAICRTIPDRADCPARRAYARDRMIEVLENQYTADGGHVEHSPGYHSFVLSMLEDVLNSGWYQFGAGQLEVLKRAQEGRGWMADATGRYPNIGDSERRENPWAQEAFGAIDGCETADAQGSLPPPCYGFNYLEDTGYAVLRTPPNAPEDAMASVFFTCNRFSATHKHADDLSFEWMDGGVYILVDAGKYAYHGDAMRGYVLSRPAHNSVFFPDAPYAAGDYQGACIDEASYDDGVLQVSGAFPLSDNAMHHRRLSYEPGVALAVTDKIEQGWRKKPFEVRWQVGPGLSVERRGEDWLLAREQKIIATARLDDACDWSVLKGENRDQPKAGWYSETYNEIRPINVLSGACPAGVETLQSVFALAAE